MAVLNDIDTRYEKKSFLNEKIQETLVTKEGVRVVDLVSVSRRPWDFSKFFVGFAVIKKRPFVPFWINHRDCFEVNGRDYSIEGFVPDEIKVKDNEYLEMAKTLADEYERKFGQILPIKYSSSEVYAN